MYKRQDSEWAVYRVEDGLARRVPVTIGRRGARDVELPGGVSPGALVIVRPDERVRDGGRVRAELFEREPLRHGLVDPHAVHPDAHPHVFRRVGPGARPGGEALFEVTDKALDFLGYRALRDLLGSMGRSSVGGHDTRQLSTGIEAGGPPRPYEFGDTMNLDASATILNAVRRGAGLDVDHEDLMVTQGDYQSSCATVLLLDCSHSMVLYGEDRFTPAKRVALALTNLIKHQYPGDSLNVVLFHDSAEEVPLAHLGRVRVGPYLSLIHI